MNAKFKKLRIKDLGFRINLLLVTGYWLLGLSGCGKKQPIGYEMIKPREGEIKIAMGRTHGFGYTYSEFANTKGAPYLFAGKGGGFEAEGVIYFEFDTLVTPESLWVAGRDSGVVELCKVLDSLDMDSVNWSNRPMLESIKVIEIKGDTCAISIEELGTDTMFYIGFRGCVGAPLNMVSYSSPRISIKEDTFAHQAMKSVYIDTSYFSQDSLPDSLTFIQTGAFVTRCSLNLKVCIIDSISADSIDTTWIEIDSLTDFLRDSLGLDSATINKAEFQIFIDDSRSYKKEIGIFGRYEIGEEKVFSPSSTVEDDSLVLNLKPIIEKWFKEGNKLWVVLEGKTQEISRVVLNPVSAKLFIVYTLPPRGR